MNSYVNIDDLKSAGMLNLEQSVNDTELLNWGISVSRELEAHCHRHFFVQKETRHFTGQGGTELWIPDLISIDSNGLKTDDNEDGTFETTWATTDYILYPFEADPATRTNVTSRPYYKIIIDDNGDQTNWPRSRNHKLVQIAGEWGFWKHLKRATETVSGAVAAADTTITVKASRADVKQGHTIMINSEQIFVESYDGDILTVIRGVNGTTAATHSDSDVIDIYEYPMPVVQAVSMTVARMFIRRLSSFASAVGLPDGSMQIFRGLDSDVLRMLDDYRLFRAA